MFMMRVLILWCVGFFWVGNISAAPQQAVSSVAEEVEEKSAELDYIAIVNGQEVSMGQYVSALRRGVRERFYHGKVEEGEAKEFRKDVADELIERALLVQEAKRRKLKADADQVETDVKAFDEKFQDDPEWAKARDNVLSELREKLNDDSLAKILSFR